MPTIGFRINSIRAERYSFEPVPQLNINMNIVFGRPTKVDNNYTVDFIIKIDCVPPIASIDIKGAVLIAPMNPDEAKKLETDFSQPSPPQQLITAVLTYTLPIIAILSRELGIPPPIQVAPLTMGISRNIGGSYEYHT
jgi:hypothetical protein